MTRVFVLGAGFSRAISSEMPLMSHLSSQVQAVLDSNHNQMPIPGAGTPIAENFEQWLSYLVEAPPWLTPADRALNQWGFITLTDAVYDVLWTRQLRALQSPCPNWLGSLVRYWQDQSSTVITFNYDLLVEIAHAVHTRRALAAMYAAPITFMDARTNMVLGREGTNEGLRLLKVHGSLNWRYAGPDSPPGDLIYEVGYESTGHSSVPISSAEAWSERAVAHAVDDGTSADSDLLPMIVPPTTVKSTYYGNHTLQLIWRKAAEALRGADELVLMGFGLAPTDLLVASLLSTTFPLTESTIITPVDYNDDILGRIREVFALEDDDPRLIETFAGQGASAIPNWIDTFAS